MLYCPFSVTRFFFLFFLYPSTYFFFNSGRLLGYIPLYDIMDDSGQIYDKDNLFVLFCLCMALRIEPKLLHFLG